MDPLAQTAPVELIFEIRYRPNPKVLDYRGTWAEVLGKLMDVSDWRITQDRLDVYNDAKTLQAFVSFRNAGVVVQDPPTRDYFADQSCKLMRYLMQQNTFGDPLSVTRFGIRSRFATAYPDADFHGLLDRYLDRYLRLSEPATTIIGSRVVDIGGPVNFEAPGGVINSMSGPMLRTQLEAFFKSRKDLPGVALYFDFDYHNKEEGKLTSRDVLSRIKSWSAYTWDLHDRLRDLILA